MTPRQVLLLLAAAALWGGAYPFVGLALSGFGPLSVVFLRCALAAAALAAIALAQGESARVAWSELRGRPGSAVLLSITSVAAPFVLIAVAQQRLPSGVTGVLVAATPICVALLAPRFDPGERVGPRQALGLGIGAAGVALVVGADALDSPAQLGAAMLVLMAAASFAAGGIVARRRYEGVPPLARALVSLALAAAFALAPAAIEIAGRPAPGPRAVAGVLVLGMVCTAFGMLAYFALIAAAGPGRAALTTYLGPVASLALGAALLGEAVTPGAVAGLGLVLAGVTLAARHRPRA